MTFKEVILTLHGNVGQYDKIRNKLIMTSIQLSDFPRLNILIHEK